MRAGVAAHGVRGVRLDDGSCVTVWALVKDMKKDLELVRRVVGRKGDTGTIGKIRIENILPSDAVDQLGQLMDLSGSSRVRPTGRRSKEISPLDTLRDPEVTLLPIDAQRVVIVRAMQDRIEEIKPLLPYIDVDARAGGLPPGRLQFGVARSVHRSIGVRRAAAHEQDR